MNPIKLIKRIFKRKEEEAEFPEEFGLATFTDEARQYGVFEDFTKEVRIYKGNDFLSYPYMKALIEAMRDYGIPVKDISGEQYELPIMRKTDVSEVEHESN